MSPDDSRHGSRAGYLAGCRDECCGAAHSAYLAQRKQNPMVRARDRRLNLIRKTATRRAVRSGVDLPPMDSAPVTAHLKVLTDLGWSLEAIAAIHGDITRQGVAGILIKPHQSVNRASRLLLDIPVTCRVPSSVDGSMLVPTLGYERRRRALLAMGHTNEDMRSVVGGSNLNIEGIRVRADKWRRMDGVYRTLCMSPGPSAKSRQRAARLGYLPPLAWDDIDDPNEQPDAPTYKEPTLREQRLDVLHHMIEHGGNVDDAVTKLGCSVDTLSKWCSDRGHMDLYRELAKRPRWAFA